MFDLHTDVVTSDHLSTQAKRAHIQKANQDGHKLVLAFFQNTKISLAKMQQAIKRFDGVASSNILSMENVLFEDGVSPQEIAKLPFAIYGLCWNYCNKYASGCLSRGGLTQEGKALIDCLCATDALGVTKVLDLAHCNQQSFFEIVDYAAGKEYAKLICTHTCMQSVNKHPRNLSDEQINLLLGLGARVGLTFVTDFLGCEMDTPLQEGGVVGSHALDKIVEHIDYYCEHFGSESLCIGTDFFGSVRIPKRVDTYDKFDSLSDALNKRGYKQGVIEGIFYQNFASYLP